MAEKLGATHTIDPLSDHADKQLIDITKGGAHKVIESAGRTQTAEFAWNVTRRGGTATILGMIGVGEMVSIHGPSFLQGKRLQGSLMGSNHFPIDIPRLIEFYQRGLLDLDSMIEAELPLEDINIGFDKLREGSSLRTVIKFEQ